MEKTPKENTASLKKSLSDLSSVLHEDLGKIEIPSGEDPLWTSCQIVGQMMGITFASPGEKQLKLPEICSRAGIRYRKVILRDGWWKENHGNLLAFSETEDPVALIYTGKPHYTLVDPKEDSQTVVDANVASRIKPAGYMFYRAIPDEEVTIWKLMRLGLQGNRSEYAMLAFSGLLAVLIGFFFPFANKIFFDNVIPNFSVPLYTQLVMGLFIASFSATIFRFTESFVLLRIQGVFKNRIQNSLWDRILKLPVQFFRKYPSGDLLQRSMLLDQIQQHMNQSTIRVLMDSFFSILYLIMMFIYSPQLSWIGIGIALVGSTVSAVLYIIQMRYEKDRLESNAKIYSFLTQVINGISKLRIAVAENWTFARWASEYQNNQKLNLKILTLGNVLSTVNAILANAGTILIFAWVIFTLESAEDKEKILTIGSFLAFFAAYGPFSQALFSITDTLSSVVVLKPYWERVKVILDEPLEVTKDQVDPGVLKGDVKIENLSFRYHENSPWILHHIDLHVKPGEFVGIVGPSGSGKSTLCRLLIGFETAEEGSIYYDGYEIRGINPNKLRSQVGTLLQNSTIFAGTVLQNIVCGGEYAVEEVERALQLSTFIEDLAELPMGLDTVMPVGGGILSGGQRQRLLLTRVLIRNPKILILDEATSSLDNPTQEKIMRNLEGLQVTRIVIAHRTSTLVNADRIYQVVDGRMEEKRESSN